MIKIIKGTYGHYDGRKVIPVKESDGPQSFAPEIEERLVKKGVAVYVEAEGKPAESAQENDAQLPEYNADMKLAELKEIATAYGVNASKAKSKAEVIGMIDAARAEAEDLDDEEPPAVDAAMPE